MDFQPTLCLRGVVPWCSEEKMEQSLVGMLLKTLQK